VSTDVASTNPPSNWPEALYEQLWPLAESIRDLASRFLSDAQDAPAVFQTDAARLERASADLAAGTRALLDPSTRPAGLAPADAMRRVRHDLLNALNRVSGYSQLLLEAEEDELFGTFRADLERIRDLSKECERLILLRLARQRPPEAGTAGTVAPPGSVAPPAVEPVRAEPATILTVDDDEAGRSALARALRGMGHTVIEAGDGRQAVELIGQRSFDLVLLDITMPVMDGYEVLRWIRADPGRAAMPVLMVSGLDEIAHTVRCIEAGAEDFLSKPVDHVLLRARINSLLGRRQLRVRELEQFFPPEVARQLIDQPEVLEEGAQTEITVLFCDIRGYSRISRRLGPANTIEWVSAVMEELSDCIMRNGGVLVDFIGDELMSMWGAPTNQPDHAIRAVRTGLEMLACLPALNTTWQDRLGEPMDLGVGLNSGPAWVGNSGTRRKFKYGPSGDTVNVGSRVQGATKYLKAHMIVSRSTHEALRGKFLSRRLGKVRVVNISEPVELYQVVPNGTAHWPELKGRYEEALDLYEQGNLDQAARKLGSLIADHGASGPALAMMARTIEGLLVRGRWDPVFELPGK
jgi:adenylate cyclase